MVISKSTEGEPIGSEELTQIAGSAERANDQDMREIVDRLCVFLAKKISTEVVDELEIRKYQTGQFSRKYSTADISQGRWSKAVDEAKKQPREIERLLYHAREAIWDVEEKPAGEEKYSQADRKAIQVIANKMIELFYFEDGQGSLDL